MITAQAVRVPHALSNRERQVLTLIAEGNTSAQIARRLALSVKTVRTHRDNLMRKLNLHECAKLVRFAIRTGLVPLDDE